MKSLDYYKKPGHDLLHKVSTATFRKNASAMQTNHKILPSQQYKYKTPFLHPCYPTEPPRHHAPSPRILDSASRIR
jgi:hypothetical protein